MFGQESFAELLKKYSQDLVSEQYFSSQIPNFLLKIPIKLLNFQNSNSVLYLKINISKNNRIILNSHKNK